MVIFMKSINQNVESIYLIQKSKFITKMIKVHSNNEIEPILNNLKIQYPNATHYCYVTRVLLHLPAVPKPDDTADALAMAITFCHTNGNQLNRFVRRVAGPI